MRTSNGDVERMERAVRLLLNRARKSERLSSLPLAVAVCNVLGISNPAEALRKAVDDAFDGGGSVQAWLRDLIVKNDLENDVPRGEAARRENVSRRQFQRFRAHAVSAIAAHLLRLVGPEALDNNEPGDHTIELLAELVADSEPGSLTAMCGYLGANTPPNSDLLRLRAIAETGGDISEATLGAFPQVPRPLAYAVMAYAAQTRGNVRCVTRAMELAASHSKPAKYDGATRFEFERVAFLRARHHARTREMATIAESMRRLALSPRSISLAALSQAEAAIFAGRLSQAELFLDHAAAINARRRDLVHAAIGTMLRARIAFCRGDAVLCDRLATGAYSVLRDRHVEARTCATVIARARAATQEAWNPAAFAEELEPLSFDRLALECERARHLLVSKQAVRAEKIARSVLETASRQGFDGIASRSAAVLGACVAARDGDGYEIAQLKRTALENLLATGDRSSAFDLFGVFARDSEFGGFEVDGELVDALLARIVVAVPQMTTDEAGAIRATRDVIRAVLTTCLTSGAQGGLAKPIRALTVAGGALVQYFAAVRSDVESIFALAAFAAAPDLVDVSTAAIATAMDLLAQAPVANAKAFSVDVRRGSTAAARVAMIAG
jgi:hypothetical protein